MSKYQEYLAEARTKDIPLYHNTSSAATQAVYDDVIKQGYEIDEDEWFQQVNGTRKPGVGKTNSFKISLSKKGKSTKRVAVFQIYNRDNKNRDVANPYELNYYIG